MPLQSLGNGCYRWGDSGKKYCGEGAKAKALKQGRAIETSKHSSGASISKEAIFEAVDNLIKDNKDASEN